MIVTWTVGPPGGEARYASVAVPAMNTPTARTAKSARLRSIPRCILGRPPLQIGPRPRVRLPEGLAPGVPGAQDRHRDARGAAPHQEDAHLRRGLLLPDVDREPQGIVRPLRPVRRGVHDEKGAGHQDHRPSPEFSNATLLH